MRITHTNKIYGERKTCSMIVCVFALESIDRNWKWVQKIIRDIDWLLSFNSMIIIWLSIVVSGGHTIAKANIIIIWFCLCAQCERTLFNCHFGCKHKSFGALAAKCSVWASAKWSGVNFVWQHFIEFSQPISKFNQNNLKSERACEKCVFADVLAFATLTQYTVHTFHSTIECQSMHAYYTPCHFYWQQRRWWWRWCYQPSTIFD